MRGEVRSQVIGLMNGEVPERARYAQAEFRLSSNLSEDLTEQVKLGALDAAVVTRVGVPRTELHFNALGTEAMTFATPQKDQQ